jgi:hypothetical protein
MKKSHKFLALSHNYVDLSMLLSIEATWVSITIGTSEVILAAVS